MNISTHYYYLLVNLCCVLFPFLLSFVRIMPFWKHWRALGTGILLMMALFIPWDIYFTSRNIWAFNENYVLGPRPLGLPLEEWLFFICVPYACTFSYECVRYFMPKAPSPAITKMVSGLIIVVALVLAVVYMGRWYTTATTILLSLLLFWHTFIRPKSWLGWFLFTWLLLLVPFYISNGVLTGLRFWEYPLLNFEPGKIADQIVWYNDLHNLGLRIWTVPADDFFYGMLMVLLTITGYEWALRTDAPARKVKVQE